MRGELEKFETPGPSGLSPDRGVMEWTELTCAARALGTILITPELRASGQTATSRAHLILLGPSSDLDALARFGDGSLDASVTPILAPHPDDPLRAADHLPVQGPDGTVEVAQPFSLKVPPGAEVLATCLGYPVAYRLTDQIYNQIDNQCVNRPFNHGPVTVCATPGLLADGRLARVPQLAAALLGAPLPPASASTGHARPPQVDTAGMTELITAAGMVLGGPTDATFARRAAHLTRYLPEAVHTALVDFTLDSHPSGGLLLTGVPIGELGPTPNAPGVIGLKDHLSELVLLTVASQLGHPVGYAPEHGGDLVQDIVPTRDGSYRQVSTSSGVTLAWHTEAAFHPHRPRYLALLCLRGDPTARTLLCSVRELTAHLDARLDGILRQPRFTTAVDESYIGARPTRWGKPRPVLAGPPGGESLWFDADLMQGVDKEAQAALTELTELINTHHVDVALSGGDLLIVDNEVAVHGRSPFTPRFDGTDRWLQRSFVVTDLAASASDRVGRIVATRFLP